MGCWVIPGLQAGPACLNEEADCVGCHSGAIRDGIRRGWRGALWSILGQAPYKAAHLKVILPAAPATQTSGEVSVGKKKRGPLSQR